MATGQSERVAEVRSVDVKGGSARATVPKRLVEQIELGHGDSLLWDYDPEAGEIRVEKVE